MRPAAAATLESRRIAEWFKARKGRTSRRATAIYAPAETGEHLVGTRTPLASRNAGCVRLRHRAAARQGTASQAIDQYDSQGARLSSHVDRWAARRDVA